MGIHSPEQIAADRADLAAHKCPECHADFKPMNKVALTSHLAHCLPHGTDMDQINSDHARRHRDVSNYIAERFKEAN